MADYSEKTEEPRQAFPVSGDVLLSYGECDVLLIL